MRSDAIVRFQPQVKEHETLISELPLRRCNHMEVIAHQQVVLRSETTMGGVLCRPLRRANQRQSGSGGVSDPPLTRSNAF
jgi:hypothetical protein